MKHLRKRFLAFLALTLFGGAGAWAQGIHVTFFDVPDSWNGDNTYITAADLEGFHSITAYEAQAGASIQPEGMVYLFYAINGQNVSMMAFASGMFGGSTTEPVTRNAFYVAQHEGVKIYYSSVIELTPSSNNTVWTLGQTPDYDLELQVEYYQKYALKDIPEGWTVMVNGIEQAKPYQGDSLMITETDSVTLIPPADVKPTVKSVTLVEPAVLVNIDGITLDITGCTTWADIIARNPDKLADDGGLIEGINRGYLVINGGIVYTSSPYDPAQQSNYKWQLI